MSREKQTVSDHLDSLLAEINVDLGVELCSHSGVLGMGHFATSLRKSDDQGIIQFWLVVSDISIFASYTMASLNEVTQDLADCQEIISQMTLIQNK